MNRSRVGFVLVATLVLAAGCHDTEAVGAAFEDDPAGGSLSVISDGAHAGGNAHFFFLPPLVQSPTGSAGRFDVMVQPEVSVCRWSGGACIGGEVAHFSMTEGAGSEVIRVEPSNELYIVNWHTHGLTEAGTYRIRVIVEGTTLGYADVQLADASGSPKRVGEIGMRLGRTIPIKFRIEEGAVPDVLPITLGAGLLHTCGLDRDGHAWCWGDNSYGQLGTGSIGTVTGGGSATAGPTLAVRSGLVFRQIVTTRTSTCALTVDGSAYCWGSNYEGTLGTGATSSPITTPTPVAGGHTFRQITAGAFHVCGVRRDGQALCWGHNEQGALGMGQSGNAGGPMVVPVPTLVVGGGTFASIGAGNFHTCAVPESGAARCWGSNYYGQLGDGNFVQTPPYGSASPVEVSGGQSFVAVSLGGEHTCALTVANAAFCWGFDEYGQVGRGTLSSNAPYSIATPTAVTGGFEYQTIAAGGYHTCGLRTDGTIVCWGMNFFGQLGRGFFSRPPGPEGIATPALIMASVPFGAVASGYHHSCGVERDGTARCWGENSYGQVGIGRFTDAEPAPSLVIGEVRFGVP